MKSIYKICLQIIFVSFLLALQACRKENITPTAHHAAHSLSEETYFPQEDIAVGSKDTSSQRWEPGVWNEERGKVEVLPMVTVRGTKKQVHVQKLEQNLKNKLNYVFICGQSQEGAKRLIDAFIERVKEVFSTHDFRTATSIYEQEYFTFQIMLLYYETSSSCFLPSSFLPDPGPNSDWWKKKNPNVYNPPSNEVGVPRTSFTKEIKTDGIKDPCIKNVIDEIKGRAFDPNAKDPDLGKIINNFTENTNARITVLQGNAIGPSGLPREASTKVVATRPMFIATITLDTERILEGVTKEYLNVLFIHEIVHAYLDYSDKRDVNNHEYIRNNYVMPMTDYLVKHYRLDRKRAAALVMRGVLTSKESSLDSDNRTPKFQYDNLGNQLSEYDLVEAGHYQFGNYGTPKCY